MPTFKSPFAQLPSAPLPGSSHFISNAVIIAKRIARGFEHPVRIEYGLWRRGNPFYDWAQRRSNAKLEAMQLRKEQKEPFFHEYVTFRLSDGKCFRIDRRQIPDEGSPMDCTSDQGVEAYDTIEQITSLEDSDSIYNPSDCLAQIRFTTGADLNLIVGICRRLSIDGPALNEFVLGPPPPSARPTVRNLTTRSKAKHGEASESSEWLADCPVRISPDIVIQILAKQPETPPLQISDQTQSIPVSLAGTKQAATRWEWAWAFRNRDRDLDSPPVMMQAKDVDDLVDYVSAMIRAHSLRVEQYKVVLGCSAEEVERDIKQTMHRIW